ncbi:hypothetical protein CY34DRAFT_164405 [Suillus luteus UH-Slu-Lm8-n1]|uniref:Unplaced genomic scaffold CY34scaffold_118, whole genome shotgun sequence n=1 Tax=Suillus luteus UH-Slu-Lm8-n1 TaxID=930992 RepID=A0A0D0AW40_9AGAM|nr:hypothetical protein CY34DRAFT_164405 [Suillus luteus UH-Slu-Lm8-n1]
MDYDMDFSTVDYMDPTLLAQSWTSPSYRLTSYLKLRCVEINSLAHLREWQHAHKLCIH